MDRWYSEFPKVPPQKELYMRDFSSFNLYHFDSLLSDEERMVRDSVRQWVEKRILPGIQAFEPPAE